jgi:hypothetical protein
MRLQKYINEKFYDAYRSRGRDMEIWENPNSKEMREMTNSGTIRFFANMKTKKIYMWDGDRLTHKDVTDAGLQPVNGFNYVNYAMKGRHADIIFGGTLYRGKVLSDSWDASDTAEFPTPDLAKRADSLTLKNVEIMSKRDFSWLDKYLNGNSSEVKRLVLSLLDRLKEMDDDGEL